MSRPVDVLAEMQQAHTTLKAWANATEMTDDHVQADAMEEARAAVAELIEAADQAQAFFLEKLPATATAYRLRKALARVRGAA